MTKGFDLKDQPPVAEYAGGAPLRPRGCVARFLVFSNVMQLLAAAIFTADCFDAQFYMLAALAMMVCAPVWLGGFICLLIISVWGELRGLLFFVSVVAHAASVATGIAVVFRYHS